jgi:GTPase SAR1 family protein
MIDTFETTQNDILQIVKDFGALFSKAKSAHQAIDPVLANWEKMCGRIEIQLSEQILRIAVVGAIKSGKSTLVNSLLGGDYLKRGAGVITSIVTRIRRGPCLKAVLFFKSWDEINAELEQAITFFPVKDWRTEPGLFDIRRKKDRSDLQKALETLNPDFLIKDGALNANCLVLSNYLKGYETVKDFVDSEARRIEYFRDNFEAHQTFVGNDALSVYLKDILLEIESGILSQNIEFADCQGSDSPNPLHLAMIQDYLISAHLIVYVVSSRTGLREADIRFLSIIKRMGILDNILFVVNCDFSEHDTVQDLNLLVQKVEQELALIKPDPKLFSFSSLCTLFKSIPEQLSRKDRDRLAQWESQEMFLTCSIRERERFLAVFQNQIAGERLSLLLKNHLEKLAVVAAGIKHWISLSLKILSGDLNHAGRIMEKIRQHDDKIRHVQSLIKDTVDGGAQKITVELKRDIDQFFSDRPGNIVGSALAFIRNYRADFTDYEERLDASGFNMTMYMVFQDFKQKIDQFMAESITPAIIRYAKEKETQIAEFMESIFLPYEAMVLDVLAEYRNAVEKMGILLDFSDSKAGPRLNMEIIKQVMALRLPPSESAMRYSAKIRTDAVLRLGFYSAIKIVKKLFKKPFQNPREESLLALRDGMRRIKRETETFMIYHFKNYRENIKFQYILKLVQGTATYIYEEVDNRFHFYLADLSQLTMLIDDKETTKEEAVRVLNEMNDKNTQIVNGIERVRNFLDKRR